ncbi:hypothetical protein TELCIR_09534 [Teladorsagia circumcincta]|uniref:Amino acid transporter transmembrane domain-containing protein n=1 Tax=Teladorsagia circumcincta TaxID=45464 RepID=A0A2G9UEI8_TELCI|nr:hypothetical protein TELCIR_09534 [Teladorsagia circumcincta]
MFACGGHAAFPTVQHDMKDPGEYTKSVVSAFIDFGWQRALIRTATMLGIVIVCESIPNFGPILDLIG